MPPIIRSGGIKIMVNGLVTSNIHVKYESPNSSRLEAMVKVKVFEK